MAVILNIETSSKICSVALACEGECVCFLEDNEGMNHAVKLAPFVEECILQLKRRELKLDAIAVSMGPGSYTGLRIGLSMAKGLAYSKDVNLIGLSTLEILAVKAIFKSNSYYADEIIIPMVDARRMEVFMGAYNFALDEIITPGPEILSDATVNEFKRFNKIIFIGDGSVKFKELYTANNAIWEDDLYPTALDMMALSEKKYREKEFLDLAFSVPIYLKEYQTTIPKAKIY